jgi:hypothetical protein
MNRGFELEKVGIYFESGKHGHSPGKGTVAIIGRQKWVEKGGFGGE